MAISVAAILLAPLLGSIFAADTSADEQQINKLEHEWGNAYVKRDTTFTQRITTEDFTFIGPEGNMVGKSEYVKSIAGDTVFTAFTIENLKVRVYGDAAVAVGEATIKARTKEEDSSGKYSFTDVFVKKDGEWKAVAGHVTSIARK